MDIKNLIRTIPDFPKPGIQFRDITTLLKDPKGLKFTIDLLKERYSSVEFDAVVGIESRGFIIGAPLAYALGKAFVPIRKTGKLPGHKIKVHYDLEYGTDALEIHSCALDSGSKVILVDDLLATGGTVLGANSLIEQLESKVVETCFVVELPDLGGKERLKEKKMPYYAICDFPGD